MSLTVTVTDASATETTPSTGRVTKGKTGKIDKSSATESSGTSKRYRRMFDASALPKIKYRRRSGKLANIQASFYHRNPTPPPSLHRLKRVIKATMRRRDAETGETRAVFVSDDAMKLTVAAFDAHMGRLMREIAQSVATSDRLTGKAMHFDCAVRTVGQYEGPNWSSTIETGL